MSEDIENTKKDYLKQLYEDYKYSIEKFDSQALYISSGALGLSLAFLKDIVPVQNAIGYWLFYLALWVFVAIILIGFIAHYKSSRLIEKRIKLLETDRFDEIKEDNSIHTINKIIIGASAVGISALVLFVSLNLKVMSEEQKSSNSDQRADTTKIQKIIEVDIPSPKKGKIQEKALPLKPLPTDLQPQDSTGQQTDTNQPKGSSGDSSSSSQTNKQENG